MTTRRTVFSMGLFAVFSSLVKIAFANEPDFQDVSQLRSYVIEKLKAVYPQISGISLDPDDNAKFQANINDYDIRADVTNLFGYITNYKEEKSSIQIDRYVKALSFQFNANVDKIVFVVRSSEYVSALNAEDVEFVTEPLAADLHVVFMADGADSMIPIRIEEMIGKDIIEIKKDARENVINWLPKLVTDNSISPIRLFYIEGNTMLSTSLILLDEFWQSLSSDGPKNYYFAIPRRDQLFLLDSENEDALPTLRYLVELTFKDNFNLLSSNIYSYDGGKIDKVRD
jgi:uncharacterized protein YtpQ (UPF0354 family)